jgi:ADP-ribosylglycohydrolase
MLVGMTTRVTAEQLSTARGCMLGLVLGDAIGATGTAVPATGALSATTAAQLACFTVEGIIRAHVRASHKGICHPPSVVWHAYRRWAAMQGIPGIEPAQEEHWPDGWIAQVPALAIRRGSAPATVAALQSRTMGDLVKPVGGSTGAHGLTRVLPVGVTDGSVRELGSLAAELAATTHTGEAVSAAAVGVTIVAHIAKGHSVEEATQRARREDLSFLKQAADVPLEPVLDAARSHPRQATTLAQLAPGARAVAALSGGLYVALSFPERDQIREALSFAASTRNGRHVAAVAGAVLGAAHGVDALPVDWVSRLELAWVADVLARDLMAEFVDRPSGSEYVPAPDTHWWDRYPGW